MIDMYQENILDHYENPRNFGELATRTFRIREANPLCGDEIEVDFLMEEGKVKDIKFHGHGCAISQAAMSMLTEEIKGKDIGFIKTLSKDKVLELLGIPVSATRLKCALLPLKAVKMGYVEYNKE